MINSTPHKNKVVFLKFLNSRSYYKQNQRTNNKLGKIFVVNIINIETISLIYKELLPINKKKPANLNRERISNRHTTGEKKKIQLALKHLKRCPISPAIRELPM